VPATQPSYDFNRQFVTGKPSSIGDVAGVGGTMNLGNPTVPNILRYEATTAGSDITNLTPVTLRVNLFWKSLKLISLG